MSIFDLNLELTELLEALHEECRDALTEALMAHGEGDLERYRHHVVLACAVLARLEGRVHVGSFQGVLRAAGTLYEVALQRLENAVFRPCTKELAQVGSLLEGLLALERRLLDTPLRAEYLTDDFLPPSLCGGDARRAA